MSERRIDFWESLAFDIGLALYVVLMQHLVAGPTGVYGVFPPWALITIVFGTLLGIPTAIAWLYMKIDSPTAPPKASAKADGIELVALFSTVATYLGALLFAAYMHRRVGTWILPTVLMGGAVLSFMAWAHAFSLLRADEPLFRGGLTPLYNLLRTHAYTRGRYVIIFTIVALVGFWGDLVYYGLKAEGIRGTWSVAVMLVAGVIPVRVLFALGPPRSRLGMGIGAVSLAVYLFSLWTMR